MRALKPRPSERALGFCEGSLTGSDRREAVAHAADGDHAIFAVAAFQLPADVRYMDVGGSLVADVAALPQVLHDLAPRERPVLGGEEGEQPELGRRQPHRLAGDPCLVTCEVDLERSED